jgi:hypothetical protein
VNDVEFDFRLTGTGWCEARLQIGEEWAGLTASYLGDALGDLVRGTLAIARSGNDDAAVLVHWEEEPGEFRWVLTPRGDYLDVQVLWLGDPAGAQEKLHRLCSRSAFYNAIAQGAQAVLDEHGLDGYKARWIQHDFPLEPLEQLQTLAE